MTDRQQVMEAAAQIAAAIGRRDGDALRTLLDPDFLIRTPGTDGQGIDGLLGGIEQIPGEILFVKLVSLTVDVADGQAQSPPASSMRAFEWMAARSTIRGRSSTGS